jgi:hypothetical protein
LWLALNQRLPFFRISAAVVNRPESISDVLQSRRELRSTNIRAIGGKIKEGL